MNSKLRERIKSAEIYLEHLEYSLKTDWISQYKAYLKGELSNEESLSLVHPLHYKDTAEEGDIRGPRSFTKEPSSGTIRCQCNKIWGYKCPVSLRELDVIEADHLFPYSLGGATVSSNKIHLCKVHNRSKGSDFHLLPWENLNLSWVDQTIRRIYSLSK